VHGIVFAELRRYVETRAGAGAWARLVDESAVGHRVYLVARQFPDTEFQTLLTAAARHLGANVGDLLEAFGEFIAPELVKMQAHSIRPEWRTLDLVEHTEAAIHSVVRASDIEAQPPRIVCKRLSESELVLEYVSARRLCGLAKGILRGIAAHYGESIAIEEAACMLHGADCCRIAVRTGA